MVTRRNLVVSGRCGAPAFGIGFALKSAAFTTYVALMSLGLSRFIGGSRLFQSPEQVAGDAGGASLARPVHAEGGILRETLVDPLVAEDQTAIRRFQEAPMVLTITVDGPSGSIDMYCATTTDRAPFVQVRVAPADLMDVFHKLCSGGSSD
jgi:hypothetical protein